MIMNIYIRYFICFIEEVTTRVSAEEERQLMASMSKEWTPEPEKETSRAIVEPQSNNSTYFHFNFQQILFFIFIIG